MGFLATWLVLVGCCLASIGLMVSVEVVRRRTTARQLFRMAPWLGLAESAVLRYLPFGVLDSLLPTSF
jgi:hypothetical protein